jgi:hypothetical protein
MWTHGHNKRIQEWNQQWEEEAQAEAEIKQARTAQEEEECLAKEVETENKCLEAEKKKPKMNGFNATASVSDSIAPCPSQYAIQKLNNFKYVELWYFPQKAAKRP